MEVTQCKSTFLTISFLCRIKVPEYNQKVFWSSSSSSSSSSSVPDKLSVFFMEWCIFGAQLSKAQCWLTQQYSGWARGGAEGGPLAAEMSAQTLPRLRLQSTLPRLRPQLTLPRLRLQSTVPMLKKRIFKLTTSQPQMSSLQNGCLLSKKRHWFDFSEKTQNENIDLSWGVGAIQNGKISILAQKRRKGFHKIH